MARSRLRRKSSYNPPTSGRAPARVGSPRWLVPLMLALFGIGLVWILVYYVSAPTSYPIPAVGAWNVAIGFGFIAAGFGLATQWQ